MCTIEMKEDLKLYIDILERIDKEKDRLFIELDNQSTRLHKYFSAEMFCGDFEMVFEFYNVEIERRKNYIDRIFEKFSILLLSMDPIKSNIKNNKH